MGDIKSKQSHQIKDNRLVRTMVIIEKNNPNGNRYAFFQQAATLKVNGCEISFEMPNPISLFISKSKKEQNLAKTIYKELIKPNLKSDKTYRVNDEELPRILDYFEHIQTSIITLYSAIEALSNTAIPDNYRLSKINKNVHEIWIKENIERRLSTTEKIGKIVPGILGIESPICMSFWEGFKKLEAIRNDIIHLKHIPIKHEEIELKFLGIFLSEKIFDYVKSGFELIKYFCEKNEKETFFPIMSKEYPIIPIEVDDWENSFTFVPFKGA